MINNLSIFDIVESMLDDKTFSSIDSDSVASYGGKYNRTVIYQTIKKEGLIDLNYFSLRKKE